MSDLPSRRVSIAVGSATFRSHPAVGCEAGLAPRRRMPYAARQHVLGCQSARPAELGAGSLGGLPMPPSRGAPIGGNSAARASTPAPMHGTFRCPHPE